MRACKLDLRTLAWRAEVSPADLVCLLRGNDAARISVLWEVAFHVGLRVSLESLPPAPPRPRCPIPTVIDNVLDDLKAGRPIRPLAG